MPESNSFLYKFTEQNGAFQLGAPMPPERMRFTTDSELFYNAMEKVDNFFKVSLHFIGFTPAEVESGLFLKIDQNGIQTDFGSESDDF